MAFKSLMVASAVALLTLSGCASTGAGNTTYSQYQGYAPVPDFGAANPGGARISY